MVTLWLRMQGVEFLLPVDVSCTKDLNSNDICCTRPLNNTCCDCDDPCVPDNAYGADLGPETQKLFSEAIEGSGTIFWNGPMGRFEMPAFAKATEAVAKAVAKATSEGGTSIIGGATLFCLFFQAHAGFFHHSVFASLVYRCVYLFSVLRLLYWLCAGFSGSTRYIVHDCRYPALMQCPGVR